MTAVHSSVSICHGADALCRQAHVVRHHYVRHYAVAELRCNQLKF